MDKNPKAPADTTQPNAANPTPQSGAPPKSPLLDRMPKWLRTPLLVVVGILVGTVELLRTAMERTYGASIYTLRGYCGMVLAALAGAGVGYYDGWMQNHLFPGWMLKGVGTALLSLFVVIPCLYAGIIHNLQRLSDVIWEGAERRHDHGITRLLTNIMHVVIPVAALVFMWDGRNDTRSLTLHVIGAVLFTFSAFHYLHKHTLGTIATVFGTVAVYAYAQRTQALLAGLGYHPDYAWPAYLYELVAFSGFIFPFFHVIFTGGWLQHINEETYGKPDAEWKQNYLEFALTAFSLLVSYRGTKAIAFDVLPLLSLDKWGATAGFAGQGTFWVSLLLFSAATVLLFSVLFITIAEVLTTSTLTTNWLVGGMLALWSGWASSSYYLSRGFAYGKLGALGVFIVATLVTYRIVYPAFYWTSRPVFNFLLVRLLGLNTKLNRLAEACTWYCKETFNTVVESWETTYQDETPFKEVVAHGMTLVATAAVYYTTMQLSQQRNWEAWRTVTAVAPPTILTLLLVGGHLLQRSSVMLGALLSIVVGVLTAILSLTVNIWPVVVVHALASILATALVFFPLPYAFACKIVNNLHPHTWATVVGAPYNACDYIFAKVKKAGKYVWITARDEVWNPAVEIAYQLRDEVVKWWEQFSSKR